MTDQPKRSTRWTLVALIIPAVAVSLASLLALVSTVLDVAAESRPGDLLYPLRQPALELELGLTTDPAERAQIELRLTAPAPVADLSEATVSAAATSSQTAAAPASLTATAARQLPAPSETAPPERSPAPAETERPGDTPEPAHTERPSETPEPTRTERPSDTPKPTRNERPSETPEPTRTERPSATPQPTDTQAPVGNNTSPSNTPRPEEERFTAVVESVGTAAWIIGGETVQVTGETEIRGEPKVGDTVEVRGLRYSEGTLVATRIEKR